MSVCFCKKCGTRPDKNLQNTGQNVSPLSQDIKEQVKQDNIIITDDKEQEDVYINGIEVLDWDQLKRIELLQNIDGDHVLDYNPNVAHLYKKVKK